MAEDLTAEHFIEEEEKEHTVSNAELSTTFATAEIPLDVQDTTEVTISHLSANDDASNSSSSSRRQSANEHMLDDDLGDDRLEGTKSASSRSSLSSIPDSVVVHPKSDMISKSHSPRGVCDCDHGYNTFDSSIHQKIRDRNSPFRHPSSVRAIQMYTEDEDEEYTSPSRRRGAGYRGSPSSIMRSPGSPLVRRPGYHSAGGTPKKPTVRTENPLVLLHCNILPPAVVLAPGINLPDRNILGKVLPPRFWRRWKLLEEKIAASGLLRDRGVLLQHPQEDYGLLEERLLESLELQRPRIENGHYVNGNDSGDSGNESNNEDNESHFSSNDLPERSCPDCGCYVGRHNNQKKWEIRFYAANGLMKEGAWTAAWKEIERIDVQISLWLPYEVKTEVERRIQEEEAALAKEDNLPNTQAATGKNYIPQEEIDGLDFAPMNREIPESYRSQYTKQAERKNESEFVDASKKQTQEVDLQTLLVNYIRILATDRRNIITVTSVLVAVWALLYSTTQPRRSSYMSDAVRFGDFPAVSTRAYHVSSASILTEVPAEVPVVEVEKRVESVGEVQSVAQDVNKNEVPIKATTIAVPAVQITERPAAQVEDEAAETAIEARTIDQPVLRKPDSVEDNESEQELPAADNHPEDSSYDESKAMVSFESELYTEPNEEAIVSAEDQINSEAA